MRIVDERCRFSGWLEYFAEGPMPIFLRLRLKMWITCSCQSYAYMRSLKRILLLRGLAAAEVRIADLYKGNVLELNASLALSAARISAETRLSMADSIILATARSHEATLYTQDEHFKDLPEVKYVQKRG